MKVASFSEIEEAFRERVQRMIWCNVATVDIQNRPRSRVLHPVWEGQIGWIATGRHTLKARDLTHNPAVSLAYIAEPFTPVYIDCRAEWVDELSQKQQIWHLIHDTPAPIGYNLTAFFAGGVEDPDFGVLKLIPWRIELAHLGGQSQIWQQ